MSHPKGMFNSLDGDHEFWPLNSEHQNKLPKTGCVYKITLDGKVSVAVPSETVVCLQLQRGHRNWPKRKTVPRHGRLLYG